MKWSQREMHRILMSDDYSRVERSFLTGKKYIPKTDPRLTVRNPVPVWKRNERYEVQCPWFQECLYSSASGLDVQKHIQRVHLSRNDRPALVGGQMYHPLNWYK